MGRNKGLTAAAMHALAAFTPTIQTLGDDAAFDADDHLTPLEGLITRPEPIN
jgi:hypothetical protein